MFTLGDKDVFTMAAIRMLQQQTLLVRSPVFSCMYKTMQEIAKVGLRIMILRFFTIRKFT